MDAMDKKLYSDRRWWDNPMPISSLCGKCSRWHGFGKCDKYKDSVPEEVLEKSFPGTEKFDNDYCPYRKNKDA